MKTYILFFLVIIFHIHLSGQITTPVIRANFGVDADLRSNYFNNAATSGNDDWFSYANTSGQGQFIIDTTGAAAILSSYATDVSSRKQSFIRRMRLPIFTTSNNSLLLDASFVRDYHGDDSTVFAKGTNKNADNPGDWTCPVSQGIPDKNDILDMMVHVRRAGQNSTDSLWMFGGMSIDNTNGNRYFDFEMYQTELSYDRSLRKFTGYGPDSGHTSWEFDAQGNVVKPGDIIFSAEYQSSTLSLIEARIWINRAALSVNPVAFEWSGKFDGSSSGAVYGYASIKPKGGGTYFTGLECGNNTWTGPFGMVFQNEALATEYTAGQYVEFSVNMTKLGLDPVTLSGNGKCSFPFKTLLAKTRSSASFTAELKDFVLPFTFFSPSKVEVNTATPYLCEKINIAEINVTNPVATSVYVWSTTDGRIIGSTSGTTIYVDKPGTYTVTQYLQTGCTTYAVDAIQLSEFSFCSTLAANRIFDFQGTFTEKHLELNWKVQDNQQVLFFEIQKSFDGVNFRTVANVGKNISALQSPLYSYQTNTSADANDFVYYRIRLTNTDGTKINSNVVKLGSSNSTNNPVKIYPNPVRDKLFVQVSAPKNTTMQWEIITTAGNKIFSGSRALKIGMNTVIIEGLQQVRNGLYFAILHFDGKTFSQKITVSR